MLNSDVKMGWLRYCQNGKRILRYFENIEEISGSRSGQHQHRVSLREVVCHYNNGKSHDKIPSKDCGILALSLKKDLCFYRGARLAPMPIGGNAQVESLPPKGINMTLEGITFQA